MNRKASEYRRRAQELRKAAQATTHQVTRDTLLKFAEEYDRMALHPVENYPKVLKLSWTRRL
jgi:hypothetical protein